MLINRVVGISAVFGAAVILAGCSESVSNKKAVCFFNAETMEARIHDVALGKDLAIMKNPRIVSPGEVRGTFDRANGYTGGTTNGSFAVYASNQTCELQQGAAYYHRYSLVSEGPVVSPAP